MAIDVVNRQRLIRIDARRVEELADSTLGILGRAGSSLTIAFVRDRLMRKLNLQFRGYERTTDVLSFPNDGVGRSPTNIAFRGSDGCEHIGDIAISTDTALRQAGDAGHGFAREVDELVIHGVLHLCGYDHETDGGQMNRLELKLRRKLLDLS